MILSTIVSLLIAALVIVIVSKLNLGLTVKSYGSAIIAAIVIAVVGGVVNWLLVSVLKMQVGADLLGAIFLLIIAAVVLMLSDRFLPGLEVKGFKGALIAAAAIAVIYWLLSLLKFW